MISLNSLVKTKDDKFGIVKGIRFSKFAQTCEVKIFEKNSIEKFNLCDLEETTKEKIEEIILSKGDANVG